MELDHAAALSHGAEEILQHLSTARAVQTGDPQDLSLPELERGVPEAGIFAGEMFHLQDGLTRLVGLGRETVGELTAYHQLDDLIHGKLLGGPCGHPGPITHDRNIVGDTEDLLHLMADVDDAAALVPQHIDDAEEMLHLGLRQGGGRLVEHNDLGVVAHRLGDLHHLPLGDGQRTHDGAGVHLHLQIAEDLLCLFPHDPLADHDTAHGGVPSQPEVVLNAAGQGLIELLVDHRHTVLQGLLGTLEVDLFAIQDDGTAILAVNAEQALHQCGFSRAVFSHQGVNGTGTDGEGDLVQGLDARELLGDVTHLQQCVFLHLHPPLCSVAPCEADASDATERGAAEARASQVDWERAGLPMVGSPARPFVLLMPGISPGGADISPRCWRRRCRKARGSC